MYGNGGRSSFRYFPRLKVFKAGQNNVFDGKRAVSYDWFTYAIVLSNGEIVETENSYSVCTSGHMSAFRSLVGYEAIKYEILAPRGLTDLDSAERAIKSEIKRLQAELLNKRNRNIQQRKDQIEKFEKQLEIVKMVRNDQKKVEAA